MFVRLIGLIVLQFVALAVLFKVLIWTAGHPTDITRYFVAVGSGVLTFVPAWLICRELRSIPTPTENQ